MSIWNITLEELLQSEWLKRVQSDFLSDINDENWGNKTLSEVMGNYGAWYHTLRQFYKGNDISEWYVKDFLRLIMSLSQSEYTETREDLKLRNYQLKFIIDTLKFIQNSKKNAGYIHSATSTGKTVVFWEVARQICDVHPEGNILIVVAWKEARDRAEKEFNDIGIPVWIYGWDDREISQRVTIITRQALIRTGKENINPDSISLMICDEIHDGFLWPKSREVLGRFPCKKIWYTATPELRNKHVEEIFGEKIGEYLIDEGQRDWYLPQINSNHDIELDDAFFDELKVQWDDYSEESLAKFQIDHVFPKVLDFFQNGVGKWKQFALFMPSVSSSKRLQKYMLENGISIAHVDGDTKNMTNVKDDFENRKIQIITSCEKMTQSWDSDVIDGVMNLRPTLSPSKYFQILWRALHGKQIVDGEKLPKDEIMMVDLVNSKESFRNRAITASWVKEVLKQNTEKWMSSKSRDRIDKVSPKVTRELQMYYEFDIDINEASVKSILEEHRAKIWVEKWEFYKNIVSDVSYYDTETEELIDVRLVSNSALWKSYSGRIREISVSLWVFLKLVKDIHDIEKQDYQDMSKYDIEFYKKHPLVFKRKTPLKEEVENTPFSEHLRHIHDNLFSDEDRRWVWDFVLWEKVSKIIFYRIINRFIHEYVWIPDKGERNIDFEFRKDFACWVCFYWNRKVFIWDLVAQKVRTQWYPYRTTDVNTIWYDFLWYVCSCNAQSLKDRGVDISRPWKIQDEDVKQIAIIFYEDLWYKVIDEENDEELERERLSNLNAADIALFLLSPESLESFNIVASSLHWELFLDCSYIKVQDRLKISDGKNEYDVSTSNLIEYTRELLQENKNREAFYAIVWHIENGLENWFPKMNFPHWEESWDNEASWDLEWLFRSIINRTIVGQDENEQAKEYARNYILERRVSSISWDIWVHQAALKSQIWLEYDEEFWVHVYDSSIGDDIVFNSFFSSPIFSSPEFYYNIPSSFRKKISESVDLIFSDSRLESVKLIEHIFEFIWLPLRDLHKYPVSSEWIQNKISSWQWDDLLKASNISRGENRVFIEEEREGWKQVFQVLSWEGLATDMSGQKYLDFSEMTIPNDEYYRKWLNWFLLQVFEGLDDEVKESFMASWNDSFIRHANQILHDFCVQHDIAHIDDYYRKNYLKYIVKPSFLLTADWIELLEWVWMLFELDLKAYDVRNIKFSQKKVFWMKMSEFFANMFANIPEEDKVEIDAMLEKGFTGIKNQKHLSAVVEYYLWKAWWERRWINS